MNLALKVKKAHQEYEKKAKHKELKRIKKIRKRLDVLMKEVDESIIRTASLGGIHCSFTVPDDLIYQYKTKSGTNYAGKRIYRHFVKAGLKRDDIYVTLNLTRVVRLYFWQFNE